MVRAILKDGTIQPTEDLPETWTEGQTLVIDVAEPDIAAEEIRAWSREIAAAAERIPDEEHERFLAALEKELKQRLDVHEAAIVTILQRVMDAIDPPALPPPPLKPRIGFKP